MGPDVADRVEYTGRGEREVFDRRVDRWVVVDVVDAYLFEVRYSGVIEFQVNPEFGSVEVVRVEVDTYAPALGRLSAVMLSRVTEVEVNAGQELFGGNANGSILIHTGQGVKYMRDGFLEEVLFHERRRTPRSISITRTTRAGGRRRQRTASSSRRTPATSPTVKTWPRASWVLRGFAVRFRPGRLTVEQRAVIEATIVAPAALAGGPIHLDVPG